MIQSLRREHDMTVISITHDLNEVAKADRVIVMNKGRIALEGTPKHIFAHGMKLEEMGLDLPFSLQLSQRLKDNRIPITTDHLTIEGLVSELWTLYSAMSNTVTK